MADTLVLGLVLITDERFSADALPGVELGAPQGRRYPAVIEVLRGEDERTLQRLREVPGVLHVDVAYAQQVEPDSSCEVKRHGP